MLILSTRQPRRGRGRTRSPNRFGALGLRSRNQECRARSPGDRRFAVTPGNPGPVDPAHFQASARRLEALRSPRQESWGVGETHPHDQAVIPSRWTGVERIGAGIGRRHRRASAAVAGREQDAGGGAGGACKAAGRDLHARRRPTTAHVGTSSFPGGTKARRAEEILRRGRGRRGTGVDGEPRCLGEPPRTVEAGGRVRRKRAADRWHAPNRAKLRAARSGVAAACKTVLLKARHSVDDPGVPGWPPVTFVKGANLPGPSAWARRGNSAHSSRDEQHASTL